MRLTGSLATRSLHRWFDVPMFVLTREIDVDDRYEQRGNLAEQSL